MAATATFDDFAARLTLTRDPAAVRKRVDMVELVLERAFVVPGLNLRLGVDSAIGLVPVAGDIIAALMGSYLVWEARNLGMPRLKLMRMMANVGVDTALGAIPFVGDVFDLVFRSNSKNLRLIKRHLDRHHPASAMVEARAVSR